MAERSSKAAGAVPQRLSTAVARPPAIGGDGVVRLSERSAIDAFIVMDVLREANAREAAGEKIIHMEVGQPATPAPRLAREAAKRAIDGGKLGYTDALGMPALRERIARHYADRYGLAISPSRIVVTTGSSAGFILTFLALFDAGDRVLLPQPGYPCYRHILTALGCRPVLLETTEADRWAPTPEMISRAAADGGAAGLLLASPANPTGTMLSPDRLAAVIATSELAGMTFISDEIYHGLSYGTAAATATALSFSDRAVVINSFSKYFSMTGWRVGWLVLPDELVRPAERLMQNLFISAPAISQVAALAAFDATEELEAIKAGYASNRALLLRELPGAGFGKLLPADGAFYLYADVGDRTADSLDFCKRMLAETGVATTPGIDFDPTRGRQFVRFSYAGSIAEMSEAMERLGKWLAL